MGKRSRAKGVAASRATAPPPSPAGSGRGARGRPERPRLPPRAPRAAGAKLDPVRKTLAAYVLGALVLAVVTLVGIVSLGGELGPFVVLAVVVVSAGLLSRAATRKLAGAELTNEDRVIQTMAGGMLFLSVVLAGAGALVALLV